MEVPRPHARGRTPRQNIHNGYKSANSKIFDFTVPKDPQVELYEQLNALDRK